MGGSSAQPQDIAGKYRPSQAALDASRLITLNMAARDIRDIGSFTQKVIKTGRNGTEIERKYSMDLLNRLETELKPNVLEGRNDQAKALLKDLKVILTKKGYCLKFQNDLMLLDAFISRVRKDFGKEHAAQEVWHCRECGSGQYKLVNGEMQCGVCFEIEQSKESEVKEIVPSVSKRRPGQKPKVINFRLAATRQEFEDCVSYMAEQGLFHIISGRNRQDLIKHGEMLGVYIPPSPGWKQNLRYKAEMFNLFGFKKPLSTAEEYILLSSPEFAHRYHAALKKFHPDTSSLTHVAAGFWIAVCIAAYKVLKNRKLNFDNGFLRKLEHPMFLTRSVEEMMWIEDVIEKK